MRVRGCILSYHFLHQLKILPDSKTEIKPFFLSFFVRLIKEKETLVYLMEIRMMHLMYRA